MDVDAFLALMRMTESGDQIVANLAKVALSLAEGIREAEARAELAEAALEAERAKVADLSRSIVLSADHDSPRTLRPQRPRLLAEAAF